MPLTITVRLRHGRYDAGGERASYPEWPPHPARVFCALAASCEDDADPAWAALRWLEEQPPPEIRADDPGQVRRSRAVNYVVKNATEKDGGGSMTWPGRDNGKRIRSSSTAVTESFGMTWTEANPATEILAHLRQLARLVPYVGRSTSLAEVTVSDDECVVLSGHVVYEPVTLDKERAAILVRVPYPGYTGELQAAYLDGRRAWEVARTLPYAIRQERVTTAAPMDESADQDADGELVPGPFEDLLVWGIKRPVVPLSGNQVAMVAGTLRRAILSVVPDPVPAQVSGHGAADKWHVGFLALPDVGHEHADGHILGLALAIPGDLPRADLAALLKAAIPLSELRLPGGRVLKLEYGAGDRAGLRPEKWGGQPGTGFREWVTATPMMLDGHLHRGQRSEASEVARSLVIAGYPRPAEVEVSPAPLLRGGVWQPRPDTLPRNRTHRRLVHARVTFPVPVAGPVLAGSMRYLGVGLFLPARPTARPPVTVREEEAMR
jgi:CRISPR-associated protein Csb2